MRYAFLAIALSFVLVTVSHAVMYRWVDKDGVLHVTDDEFKVPAEYRKNMTVIEEAEPKPPLVQAPAEIVPPLRNKADEEYIYGDHTLQWWRSEIKRRKDDMAKSEKDYGARKQFIEVFEKGRNMGQIYEQSEVDIYNKYKKEIPEIKNLSKNSLKNSKTLKTRPAGPGTKERQGIAHGFFSKSSLRISANRPV